ncbi:putative U6 snRNA-associated Sm-like protein LSm4 [Thelohanellus kitauei]|uniref:U6 snRNA-associated Sm-like protein LSm4 n=1 Tax=Thelohanellus kitauei TaxID=669202 RepID=A0A0C2IY79_THEKT|nr:putative U6 snRNA-associated Sm-like protein LSm4 [Thelohanellus kitauei]
MVFPISVVRAAQGQPLMVELKNGETYNGNLVNSDHFMNVHLRDVICTSKDGEKFWKMMECFIRGVNIKYIRIPPEILGKMKEDNFNRQRGRIQGNRFKGQFKKPNPK